MQFDTTTTKRPMSARSRVRVHFDALHSDVEFRKWLV